MQEYSIWPPPPELRHFLSYLQVIKRPKDVPATVYTGTLGLAGKSAYSAYDIFAKEKTKEVRAISPGAALPLITDCHDASRLRLSSSALPLDPSEREYLRH